MAIQPIRLFGDPVLRTPAKPVVDFDKELRTLVADLEADLVRLRTREGMAEASAKGHLRGRRPTLTPAQERQLVTTLHEGSRTASEVAEIFGVSRATVYRAVRRVRFPGDG